MKKFLLLLQGVVFCLRKSLRLFFFYAAYLFNWFCWLNVQAKDQTISCCNQTTNVHQERGCAGFSTHYKNKGGFRDIVEQFFSCCKWSL